MPSTSPAIPSPSTGGRSSRARRDR
jgi:hypothetical protein